MGWATNFLNRIFDQQEKLSPAEAEEAERKIRTQKRAEIKRIDEERRQNIRDKAEKFRLPGSKGSSSYDSNGELQYSNAKIKGVVEKEKWESLQKQREDLRDWIKHISLTHTKPERLIKALESGDPKDLIEEDRREWRFFYRSINENIGSISSGIASTVKYGKRGGKYYLKRNKKGESYRRYF